MYSLQSLIFLLYISWSAEAQAITNNVTLSSTTYGTARCRTLVTTSFSGSASTTTTTTTTTRTPRFSGYPNVTPPAVTLYLPVSNSYFRITSTIARTETAQAATVVVSHDGRYAFELRARLSVSRKVQRNKHADRTLHNYRMDYLRRDRDYHPDRYCFRRKHEETRHWCCRD